MVTSLIEHYSGNMMRYHSIPSASQETVSGNYPFRYPLLNCVGMVAAKYNRKLLVGGKNRTLDPIHVFSL